MIKKFTHVGLVVRDIDKAREFYAKVFGFQEGPLGVLILPELGIKSCPMMVGRNFIELLEPTDDINGPGKFLKERGEGLYHISLRVDDIRAQVASLRSQGVEVSDPHRVPSLPFESNVAFIEPKCVNNAIIELTEHPHHDSR